MQKNVCTYDIKVIRTKYRCSGQITNLFQFVIPYVLHIFHIVIRFVWWFDTRLHIDYWRILSQIIIIWVFRRFVSPYAMVQEPYDITNEYKYNIILFGWSGVVFVSWSSILFAIFIHQNIVFQDGILYQLFKYFHTTKLQKQIFWKLCVKWKYIPS